MTCLRPRWCSASSWLQRGRTRWSAECADGITLPDGATFTLQRGRTRWSAECSVTPQRRLSSATCFNGAALVGVRNVSPCSWKSLVPTCRSFNGAALVGVRNVPLHRYLRSATNRFNGAALVGVRNARAQPLRPGWNNCFNGAALVGVRNATTEFHALLPVPASTGPHSLECGMKQQTHSFLSVVGASTGPHSLECGMCH